MSEMMSKTSAKWNRVNHAQIKGTHYTLTCANLLISYDEGGVSELTDLNNNCRTKYEAIFELPEIAILPSWLASCPRLIALSDVSSDVSIRYRFDVWVKRLVGTG